MQLTPANVTRLERAWTFQGGKPGSEATPLVIDGVMYLTVALKEFRAAAMVGSPTTIKTMGMPEHRKKADVAAVPRKRR